MMFFRYKDKKYIMDDKLTWLDEPLAFERRFIDKGSGKVVKKIPYQELVSSYIGDESEAVDRMVESLVDMGLLYEIVVKND